jgi:hypothetical protein
MLPYTHIFNVKQTIENKKIQPSISIKERLSMNILRKKVEILSSLVVLKKGIDG